MRTLRNLSFVAAMATLATATPLLAEEAEPGADHYTGNDAATWVPLRGEEWWNYYHPDYESQYPGGRSNRYHDIYIGEVMAHDPATTDWEIFNRKYFYEGDMFAVEWYYRSTYTDDGFRQWESTMGFGRIVDGQIILWIEYFDDAVGTLQKVGLMPYFEDPEAEVIFPWPEDTPLKAPYRP